MAERKQGDQGTGDRSAVITQTKTRTQRPSMYRVLILNDDYTPMEFVVYVLEQYFHKSREEATQIMLHVHQTGVGICGIYTYEVAETKVAQVIDTARRHQHPLQCTMTPTKHLQHITMKSLLFTTVTTKLQEELNNLLTTHLHHHQPTTHPHNRATINPNPVPSNSTLKNLS